jgi:hypothetical protein
MMKATRWQSHSVRGFLAGVEFELCSTFAGGAGLPLRCPAPGQRRPLVSAATIVPSVSLASRSYVLVIRSWSAYDSNHGNARLVPSLPQQLRQLGDVGGDAPGLVAGEQLGRRAPSGGS